MGKKIERGGKDKSASSGHHADIDDSNKSPEPYVCTGKFHDDFESICNRASLYYTPSITNRAHRPGTPPPPVEAKPEKGKDKAKRGAPEPVAPPPPEPDTMTEDGEPPEPPPKTYTVTDRFDYFKPNIEVEMDNPDKHDTVTELFIRGWKIDKQMMNIFKQCWSSMDKLHTINLWNAGLTGETLKVFGAFLPQCVNVKTLFLEGSTPPVQEENFHVLLHEESQLTTLSLRHNGISDLGAKNISSALGGFKSPNTKVLTLNLTGNRIGDEGAKAIANALRMNRTLLSLNLAQNQISDSGAKELAETLKCFPLSHEEIVERRKLKSEKGVGFDGSKTPPPSRRADSKDRPGSHRSSSHLGKDKRDKSSKKKDDKADTKGQAKGKGKEAEKTQGGKKEATKGKVSTVLKAVMIATAESTKAATKGGKDKKGGKGAPKGATPNEPEPEASDLLNPLLESAENIDNQLWIPGNRVLINLNLQRNKMTAEGINAFKLAIQYQDTILLDTPKAQGTGLMRLIVNKNLVGANNEDLMRLNSMMLKRDPFYKPPATPDVAGQS